MRGGIPKSRAQRARLNLSASREKLLDAVGSKNTEPPPSHPAQRPVSVDLAQDTTASRSRKRRPDAASTDDPLPAKRRRLTRTDAQTVGHSITPTRRDKHAKTSGTGPVRIAPSVPPHGPQIEAGPASEPSASKRAGLTRANTQQLGVERKQVGRAAEHKPPGLKGQEQVSPAGDGDKEHQLQPARLTRKNLAQLDKMAKKKGTKGPASAPPESAPEMGYTGAGGFAVPPTPASIVSRSYQATEDSASSTASVRHPSYRQNNLNSNGIYVRDSRTQLPNHISSHVETLRAKKRDSPGPPLEQVDEYLDRLDSLARGCIEADVEGFLEHAVFPKDWDRTYGSSAGLGIAKSSLMSSHLIPNNPESPFRVSGPKPDLLYGYSGHLQDGAFTQPQLLAQASLHTRNARFAEATTQGLRFPFFAIEFKAAGGTRGDLWVATNQCAGASAACLSAVDQLNSSLREYSAQSVDNLSYCIAVDNNVAKLYISWKGEELDYYLQQFDTFLLSRPEEFLNFRKQVRNILDWGKDERLKQIRGALDIILEENRKSVSSAAKSRSPPSHKSSSSRKTRSDHVQY